MLKSDSKNPQVSPVRDEKFRRTPICVPDAKRGTKRRAMKIVPLPRRIKPPHRVTRRLQGHEVLDFDAWRAFLPSNMDSDDYKSGVTAVSSLLVNPNEKYLFRLTTLSASSSTVGGVLAGAFAFDPSGTFEYGTLSLLFNMVRIVHAKLTWVNMNPNDLSATIARPALLMCSNPGRSGTVPSAASDLQDEPDSRLFSLAQLAPHVMNTPRYDNEFALVSAPIPGPYAGCYGQFAWYQSTTTASTKYGDVFFEGIYEFSARN